MCKKVDKLMLNREFHMSHSILVYVNQLIQQPADSEALLSPVKDLKAGIVA